MHILERAGCPLHYWLAGPIDRPLVVFLHGMTMNHHMFDLQVESLAAQYRVLVPDLRGHGRSQPLGAGFTIDLLLDDLLAILDQVSAGPAALIGHSMGGMLAQELLFRRPERVSALAAYGIPCSTLPVPRLLALRKPIAPLARQILRLLPYKSFLPRLALKMAERPEVQAQALAMMRQVPADTFRKIVTALPDGRHGEPGYRIPCPLLILRGEHDPYGGGPQAVVAWAGRDRHAQVVEIANAGHNANQDNPDEFNQVLLGFLEKVER